MRPVVRLALSVLCAALVAPPLTQVQAAPAARQGNQGLQGGWAVDDQGNVEFYHSLITQLPTMREARGGWVRINFRLGGCFQDWKSIGCNGRSALQTYETVVQAATSSNLKIVGLLSNESWHGDQAQWIANNAENNPTLDGDNPYIRAFVQNAVVEIVRQFSPRVTTWEIWNEPNAWTGLDASGDPTGGTYMHPSNFAQLLRQSRTAVRQTLGTSGVVVAGAIFSHDPEGLTVSVVERGVRRTVTKRGTLRGTRQDLEKRQAESRAGVPIAAATPSCETVPSGADYLCATYEMGRSKAGWDAYRSAHGTYPLDHVGQTLYVDQGGPTSSNKLKTHLQELRNAYTRYEGTRTAKRTWVEEVGWTTPPNGGVSLDVQARNLQTAFGVFRTIGFVGRAFWFNVQDVPEAWPGLYYGLVNDIGGKKPSFGAYQTYATY